MHIVNYKNIIFSVPERYHHSNLLNRFKNDTYEKEESIMINKFYNKNDIVLEVGSCLGYIAYLLSKKVYSVISIEGNPELKEALNDFKKNNNIDNVTFLNTYISNTIDVVNFQTYDNIVAGSGDRKDKEFNNVRGWGSSEKIYKVKTIKLKDIQDIEKINSFVLDMEGGELIFLKENIDFIKKQIKKITFEVHGHLMYKQRSHQVEYNNNCFKLLIDNGFILKGSYGNTFHFEKL